MHKIKKMKNLIILIAVLFLCDIAYCQIDIGGKIKNKAQNKLEQKTDQAIDKGFNKTEEGVNGVLKKKDKDDKKKKNKNNEQSTDTPDINSNTDKPSISQTTDDKPLESYSKYDFIPGDKILFFEDFSQDAIGDFPALWSSNSSGEVKTVSIAQGKWFHLNGENGTYCLQKDIAFPDNYIIEFDIIPDKEYNRGIILTLFKPTDNMQEVKAVYIPDYLVCTLLLVPRAGNHRLWL